jgi:hypothetical protein
VNAQRDTNGIVRSWLENGVTDLPDRVLDPVLDQLPSTPQRRHSWQARRLTKMNTTLKIAGTAAAVVVLGVVGMTLLRGSPASSVGTPPSMAPTPTAVPSQAPSASTVRLLPSSAFVLEPGRYRIGNVSFLVPAGWTGHDTLILKDNAAAANAALFAVWPITGTFVDPCTDHTLVTPTPGPGIDDLADALASQRGTSASPPRRVNVDGYPAKVVDVTVTADIDACEPAGEGFWLWAAPGGDRRYVQGANELNQIYIVDVDGQRVTFNSRIPEATTAADRAELDAIIASVEIEG